ncbi:hypothetical protein [uncultured Hymenobacter sp.]|uniref:hypothetical protein n=1 Tax=uncultured Hymenobacter sp. TaxID=170016 RepID=UPI0035CAE3E5
MIQETDDDRLDESLRDTFSDFDLLPSSHVWAGIEGHLSALPSAPRPVPLLLVLPLVGLVGVTVGWLLPRPATVSPPPPTTETAAKTRMASLHSQLSANEGMAYTIPRSSTQALAFRHTPRQVASLVDKPASKTKKILPLPRIKGQNLTSYSASQPQLVASANTSTPTDLLPLSAVSLTEKLLTVPTDSAVQVEPPTTVVAPIAAQQHSNKGAVVAPSGGYKVVEVPAPSSKGEGLRERRPEYRVPTHRLSERGRGLRRIQNNFVKHWQHLFGPRRARVAAQPDF